jgi:hypothetical protein
MIRIFALSLAMVLLASCDAAPDTALAQPVPDASAPDAAHPVVLELYQSQGCSSCPPANANLNALSQRRDVLALSFAVTYWDRLGWPDRFAQPAFTERQWDYARANQRSSVWTPQLVINGRATTVTGREAADIAEQIQAAGRPRGGPALMVSNGELRLGAARVSGPATIWLVRYDPREQRVPISAGENEGRTLPHRNIVRQLRNVGTWTGAAQSLSLPPSPDVAWASAILIQRGRGGPIIAARRL